MTVMIEAEPECDAAVAARVRRELHDLLSLSPELRLCRLGEIERAQGKAVRGGDLRAEGRSRARGGRGNGRMCEAGAGGGRGGRGRGGKGRDVRAGGGAGEGGEG